MALTKVGTKFVFLFGEDGIRPIRVDMKIIKISRLGITAERYTTTRAGQNLHLNLKGKIAEASTSRSAIAIMTGILDVDMQAITLHFTSLATPLKHRP